MFRKGFTLVEIVVAIAISTLLLAGTAGIVTKAADALASAKSKWQTYSALTDAISRLGSVRNAFPLMTVVQVPSGYDFVVFTNSGKTAGILVGVANAGSGTDDFRLDPVADYADYGEKVLAVQDITASQTAAVLADHSAAYGISIREESLFRKLVFESFEATPYNAGKLADLVIGLYVVPHRELEGKPKTALPDFPMTVNLVL